MSLIARLVSRLGGDEARALSFQDAWGQDLIAFTNGQSASGARVDDETAARLTAVWASWRIISEGAGTLPADTFVREGGARRPLRPRPRWLDEPNTALRLSRADLFGQVLVSLLSSGNAYVATFRASDLTIVALEVLDPRQVTPERSRGGSGDAAPRDFIQYRSGGKVYGPLDVLHIRGMTKAGSLEGMDPLTYAAEAFGTALSAQEYGARFFANGALPSAVIQVPGVMTEAGARLMRRAWETLHGGSGNAGKVGVLTEGATFNTVSLTPEQTQFLETRRFSISDVARIYGVPPHLLADASGSTSWGSGLSEQSTAYVMHTLRPWVERLEWGLTWLAQSEGSNPRAFVKMNVDGIQRGDFRTRVETYMAGVAAGLWTVDEVRAWEDLPPLTTAQRAELAPAPPAPTPTPPEETTP